MLLCMVPVLNIFTLQFQVRHSIREGFVHMLLEKRCYLESESWPDILAEVSNIYIERAF